MVASTTRITPRHILLISKPPPSCKARNARLRLRRADRIGNATRHVHLPSPPMRFTTLSWHLPKLREILNRQTSANAHEYVSFSDRTVANTSEIPSDGVSYREISPVPRRSKCTKPSYENVTKLPPRNKRPELQSLRRTPSPSFEEIT